MAHKALALLIILVAALGLRFSNLTSWPIFADESIYIRWSQVMRAEPSLRFVPLSDGKQPLYMWATIPFLKIFSDPLLAGRVFSALAGLGTIAGIAAASYILFKTPRQTLIAASVAAVLPYLVFFNRLALADSLLAMFLIWTFVFSLLSFLHHRLDLTMFAGFSLGFAWLTKSPAIFAFVLLPLNILFLPKYSVKNILISIFYFLVSVIIATGMYNILRLGPEFHMISIRNADYVFSLSEVLSHPLDPLIPHLKDSWNFYLYLATPVGVALLFWALLGEGLHHWRQRFVLSAWFLGPIFIQSAMAKQFTARYLLFTVPFAILLMSHAIEHIGQKTQKHILTVATASLLILLSLWTSYQIIFNPENAPLPRIERSGYLEEWTAGYGLYDVSQQLRQIAKSGPVVVGSEGFFGTPFSALQAYLNDVPNVRIIGVGVWIDSVNERLTSALADNQVFLVVNSTRFHVSEPEKIGLKLISSYPKAIRPDSSREFLLFFQVLKP